MIRRPPKRPSPSRARAARLIAAACGTGLIAAGLAATPTAGFAATTTAAPGAPPRTAPADDNSDGNGRHNRTAVSVRSPTHNRGYQHTSSGNAGGENSVQNALCRGASVCNVTQNFTIVRPAASAPPEPVPFILVDWYGLALTMPPDPESVAAAPPPVTSVARYANIPSRPREASLRRETTLRPAAGPPHGRRRPG